MDEVWDEIIQEFLEKMRRVRCDAAEFQSGLRYALEQIQTEIQASEEMS
jgi:hypothetical protein